MTLKEKFQEEPVVVYQESFILTNQSAEQLVEIADDFAIGFAEWLNEIDSFHSGENAYFFCGKWYDYKQILEIYKKEKGL